MKEVVSKSTGDQYTAEEFNELPRQELQNAVLTSGQTLNESDQFQLSKGIANYAGGGDFYTDSGTANSYLLSTVGSKEGITAYVDGIRVRFLITNTNTGASTVNVNSIGSKNIKKADFGTALSGGELVANRIVELVYNLSNDTFIVANNGREGASLPTNYKTGLLTEIDSGDTSHDIKINIGEAKDSSGSVDMSLTTAIIKQIDANWAEGTNQGGFPSGLTLSADTWYHLFVISKADGTVDAGFDSSLTAANLLADATAYNNYRRVASIRTDVSSNIIPFHQYEKYFWYNSHILATSSIPNTFTLFTVPAPLGIKTRIFGIIDFGDGGAGTDIFFRNGDQTTGGGFAAASGTGNTIHSTFPSCMTNTSSQIYHEWQVTAPTSYAHYVAGYEDISL